MKRALSWCIFAVLLLCLGMAAALAADLPLMDLNAGDTTAGSSLSFSWSSFSGASHYEYSVRDTTTNELHIDHKSTTGRSGSLSRSYVEAGHSYHIWVGAYNSAGTLIAQAHADAYAECKYHDYNSKGVCVDCGTRCPHDDWDRTTGTCEDCGKACPHDGDVYESITKMNYTSISSSKHRITITYSNKCEICFYTFETGLTRTKEEAHNLDKNGDCKDCDYRAVCQHTKTEYVLRDGYPAYSTHNEEKHKIDKQYSKVCSDCDKVLEQFADDARTIEYAAHTYNSKNTCTKCGYVKPAAQKPLSISVSASGSVLTTRVGDSLSASCSATGGSGSYQYAWAVLCDGGTVAQTDYSMGSSYNAAATRTGAWSFVVYVRDTMTGEEKSATSRSITVKECLHSTTSNQKREDTYEPLNETYHTVITHYDKVCSKCNQVVNVDSKTTSKQEQHTDTDVCTLCGYTRIKVCLHQSTSDVPYGSPQYREYNAQKHEVTQGYQKVCDQCGEVVSTYSTVIYDDHFFVGSFCSHCGAAKPVTPPPATPTPAPVTPVPVTPVPEHKHQYQEGVCTICSLVCSHNYDYSSYCYICNMQNKDLICMYSHAMTIIIDEREKHPEHKVTIRCEDCGYEISYSCAPYHKCKNILCSLSNSTLAPLQEAKIELFIKNNSYKNIFKKEFLTEQEAAINELNAMINSCKHDKNNFVGVGNRIIAYGKKGVISGNTAKNLFDKLIEVYDSDSVRNKKYSNTIENYSAKKNNSYDQDISEAMVEFCDISYSFDEESGSFNKDKLANLGFEEAEYLRGPEVFVASKMNKAGEPVVVIAFRGTQTLDEWEQDAEFLTTPDDRHTGFDQYVRSFEAKVGDVKLTGIDGNPSFSELCTQAVSGKPVNIFVTGHSLGGALTQLFIYDMLDSGLPNECIVGYTYASPRPIYNNNSDELTTFFYETDAKLIDMIFSLNDEILENANIYNIVNANDLVPQVGASVTNGERIGTDIYINVPPDDFTVSTFYKLAFPVPSAAWEGIHHADYNHDLDQYRNAVREEAYYTNRAW